MTGFYGVDSNKRNDKQALKSRVSPAIVYIRVELLHYVHPEGQDLFLHRFERHCNKWIFAQLEQRVILEVFDLQRGNR